VIDFFLQEQNKLKQNRHYIKMLAKIIVLCSHQEIALRGHREHKSLNKGKFFEFIDRIEIHD